MLFGKKKSEKTELCYTAAYNNHQPGSEVSGLFSFEPPLEVARGSADSMTIARAVGSLMVQEQGLVTPNQPPEEFAGYPERSSIANPSRVSWSLPASRLYPRSKAESIEHYARAFETDIDQQQLSPDAIATLVTQRFESGPTVGYIAGSVQLER